MFHIIGNIFGALLSFGKHHLEGFYSNKTHTCVTNGRTLCMDCKMHPGFSKMRKVNIVLLVESVNQCI